MTYTEFIASKALQHRGKKVLELAEFDPEETPIAIQIFGREPSEMAEAARVIEDLGASIIDINMGCPSKKVCAHSGGSALMKEPDHAVEIVKAVRKAVSIPLTVKMRSGFDADTRNAPELAYRCQEEGAETITIHWRTREDRYGGIRSIDKIAETKQLLSIPVIANGDIVDIASAEKMYRDTGCDGIMVGRGTLKNPWLLQELRCHFLGLPWTPPSAEEKQQLLFDFLDHYYERFQHQTATLGKFKQIAKYFCESLSDARSFRATLLRAQSIEEAKEIINQYFDRPLVMAANDSISSTH